MNARTALPLALAAVVAGAAVSPALAGPKPKPITEEYEVTGVPIPLPILGDPGIDGANSCTNPAFEGISTTTKTIETKGAGTLTVELTGFAGDWDITVMNGDGDVLGIGAGTTTADPSSLGTDLTEKAVVKTKKPMTLQIAVCNFGGGPSASAKYTFTHK